MSSHPLLSSTGCHDFDIETLSPNTLVELEFSLFPMS